VINASRKKRIAAGSGTKVEDVNRLLRQFEQMQKMMKQLSGSGKQGRKMRQMLSQMQGGGGMPPMGGGMPF
jgi:signal recognition particle subunit SRP54